LQVVADGAIEVTRVVIMSLQDEILNMKIIDGHLHAVDPWYWLKAVGSYPFLELTAKLPMPGKFTTITRREQLLACYQAIYDFPYTEFTPENEEELQKLYDASRSEDAKYTMKAFDAANIEAGVQMCLSEPLLPPGLPEARFARAQLVDGFIIPLDNSGLGNNLREKQFLGMCEYYPGLMRQEMNPQTFDDYLNMTSVTLERLVDKGVAALKMNFSYWRDIEIGVVDKADAEDVYNTKDTSPARYKLLQDYLLRHLIAKAATLDIPIHIHVGPTAVTKPMETTSPARFDPFLWLPDIMPAKIVLLHGCYPYTRESGFMVSRMGPVPNLYLDVSLFWYFVPGAPEAALSIIRDWILAGIVPKMIYGSDSPSVHGIMLAAISARHAFARVLQELVDEGTLGESQALDIASAVFYDNAKALYAGKL
jgi:predicted TIM-barrel fold metal-dependent hydrolase